jgi:hypothetical protein
MRVKLAQADGVGGACPPPFITFTITSKVAVYAPTGTATKRSITKRLCHLT